MACNVVGLGSYFTGARVRQQYWRDPARVVEETCGDWRPPQEQPQRQTVAKSVAEIKPASDFAIKLAEACKKLGLS